MRTNKKNIQINYSFFRKLLLAFLQKRKLFGLLALSILSSCETVIEIDLPVEKPRVVVNSIFNTDSVLTVNVTKSRSTNSSGRDFETVADAVVEVFKNNQSLGILNYAGAGNYRSLNKLTDEALAVYSINVRAPQYETAEALEIMPVKPVIGSFEVDTDNNNSFYPSYKTRFTLNDANESNFYFLRVWLIDGYGNKNVLSSGLTNILGQFYPHRQAGLEIHVFDDRSFNGKTVTFDIELFQVYVSDVGSNTIIYELASINKSYFDYLYDVDKRFADIPLLSPKNLPIANNITNGLGIFAAYNAASFSYQVVR